MKKITLTLTALIMVFLGTYAQVSEKNKAEKFLEKKGELTFSFQVSNHNDVERLTQNISIVNYNANTQTVTAWANEEQFREFESLNIPFNVPSSENEVEESDIYDVRPLTSRTSNSTLTFPLGTYPTYAEYVQQMQDFENDYPNLVETFSIGQTVEGKDIWFVKISDNIATDEQEPKLMYTSSMHGDEIAGYPMMLTLIDYILTVYSNTGHPDHARVKNLVENTELWINPSANPDGTYYQSANNTSVVNSRRANANGIDLNRNYPDNVAGPHDDGQAYQPETIAFMNLAAANHFVISANFHGGTELFNYPFDNAYASQYEHPDGDWFEFTGVEYATHAQTNANNGNTSSPSYTNKPSYMTDDDDSNVFPSPGVTHGAEWYRVYGGRQDYMNFYHQCKEVTLELSDTKILPESRLVDYWYYNRDALLDYLTQGTYGFRGVVKDANTDEPIAGATVTLVGHDDYGSHTFTEATYGNYYRPVKAGTYNIRFEAPCYQPVTLTNQSISDYQTKSLADIMMTPATVVEPTNLNATNETASSADLAWTGEGESFSIQYKQTGESTWTEINDVTDNPYTLTGLEFNTNYVFRIKAFCGTNGSDFSSPGTFSTTDLTYCNAQGNDISEEYIGAVNLNGINNNTLTTTNSGYSDFTGSDIFDPIQIGSLGNSISVSKEWPGSQYNEAITVWIDFNRNGTFENNEEKVFQSGANQTPTVSGTFPVPTNATAGKTRMRVLLKWFDTNGNVENNSCATINYGEVEDYDVFLYDGLLYTNDEWYPNSPDLTTGSLNVLIKDGTFNVSSNIEVSNVIVATGATLSVSKENAITVNGDIENNGEFILNSDSNEFSSLLLTGTATGNLKYNRHVNSNTNRNDLIAPPFSGQSFTDFRTNNSNIVANPSETLYLFGPFDKAASDYLTYSNTEITNLEAGKGYRTASTDNSTFTFEGAVTTGNLNVPIFKSGSAFQQWNLIGNPYPTYIDLEDFLNANISQFDSESVAVYGYDADNANGSYWTIWNLAYASANPNTLIAPGQGFFVSSKDGGGSIAFSPTMRAAGSSDDFVAGRNGQTNPIAYSKLQLNSSSGAFDTDLYFTDNASLGLDPGYDAGHFGNGAPSFAIYSELVQDNQGLDLAVQAIGFNDVDNNAIIPLGINAAQGQQLTISLIDNNLERDIYLEDTATNTFTLLNTTSYTFNTDTALSDIGRFFLRFSADVLSVTESDLDVLQVYNDSKNKQIVIKGILSSHTKLALYDVQGREILNNSLDTNSSINTINVSDLSKGIYIVKISNRTSGISKKIIVR